MMMQGNGFRVGYVPAVATVEDRLAGRVSTPGRVVVAHVTGWRIDWTEGARLADIIGPDGTTLDGVQVVAWEWDPAEGGRSRMIGEPPIAEDLAAALAEYVEANADALGLPGLPYAGAGS